MVFDFRNVLGSFPAIMGNYNKGIPYGTGVVDAEKGVVLTYFVVVGGVVFVEDTKQKMEVKVYSVTLRVLLQ